jgi:hypothetical protein
MPAPLPRAYHTLPSGEHITVVKETLLLDLCDEDSPTSGFIQSSSALTVKIATITPPLVPATSITEQIPAKVTINLKKGKQQKRPKKPKLLSKAEFRLPWNNPEWGSITPKAELRIIGSSIEKSFNVTAVRIKEKKKSVIAVQTHLKETIARVAPKQSKNGISTLTIILNHLEQRIISQTQLLIFLYVRSMLTPYLT